MAILPTGIGPVTGYNIERSLRFNSADSAYLNRTPGSAGNRRTWTWSGWVKRGNTADGELFNCYIGSGTSNDEYLGLRFNGSTINLEQYNQSLFVTTSVYRDFSAWYHIVCVLDTTQATANNRFRLYVNGNEVTDFATRNNPTQNATLGINQAAQHAIGRQVGFSNYLGGYLTEINFIDGQALTPSDFGETDINTGVWKPKAYSGTYGTNGFFLKFADNSGTTSTTLGKDSSGNGNNWTPNNFSVTAGAGNDSLVDTPTNYGTDTGVGGEVRGNYATFSPLYLNGGGVTASSYTQGNLQIDFSASGGGHGSSTISVSSGKWYSEFTLTAASSASAYVGIRLASAVNDSPYSPGETTGSYGYRNDGQKVTSGTTSSYGASWTTNDVISVALDLDAGTLTFYKNGSTQGQAFSGITGTFLLAVGDGSSAGTHTFVANFGQRAFAYTAPSGFKALCTQNLPTPAVVQGDDYFNTVLYTGNATTPRAITGYGFGPEFIVQSRRDTGYGLMYLDIVRGTSKRLTSASTAVEDTYNLVSSFDSDGFTMNVSDQGSNASGGTYVAWGWKAGGTGVTNTAGQITSTVSANTTAGFSIVTFTTDNTTKTVGHGLGVKPSIVIVKSRSVAGNWLVITDILGSMQYGVLNSTAAFTSIGYSAPTSTVFSYNDNNLVTQVAYCFAPVAGYSAFGSYTGNGSTDGPFVYTGFRPRWIMIKRTDSTGNWQIQDTARTPYNWTCAALFADLTSAEVTGEAEATYGRDYLSNGFKIRASHTSHNASGGTYVYMAFAENPFKHSLAR